MNKRVKLMVFTQVICLLALSGCSDVGTLPDWIKKYDSHRDALCLPVVNSNWAIAPVSNDIELNVDSLYDSHTGSGRCIVYNPNVKFEDNREDLLDTYLYGGDNKRFLMKYPEYISEVNYMRAVVESPSFYSLGDFLISPMGGFHAKKTLAVRNFNLHIEFDEFIHKGNSVKFLTLLFFNNIQDNDDYWNELHFIFKDESHKPGNISSFSGVTEKNGRIDLDKYVALLYRNQGYKTYEELASQTLRGDIHNLSEIDSIFATWYLLPSEIEQMNKTCSNNLQRESFRKDVFAQNGLLNAYQVVKDIRPYYAKYIDEAGGDNLFRVISLTQADSILHDWGVDYRQIKQ